MLIKIDLDNINILDNSFLLVDDIKKELVDNPFINIFVYVIDNKVIGYLNYSLIYDRIELNQIEVLNTYRRNGVGSLLLEYLIKLDFPITLEVKEDNSSAISLYEKFGFKKVAIRKGYYNGIDGILMERKWYDERYIYIRNWN